MSSRKPTLLPVFPTLISGGLALLVLVGYAGAPVADGGKITGTIRLKGEAPALAAHQVTEAVKVCGQTVPNEEIVAKDGGLGNAVVWIDNIQSGMPKKKQTVLLDQKKCRYVPHVMSATVNSNLVITSSDPTLHNIHGFLGRRTVFNVAMPVKGMRISKRLNQPGQITVKCDAGHTWMSAYIHVFPHPYHVVSSPDGRFELPNVPPGTYTLKAWHERLGSQTAEVTVAAGGTVTKDIEFRAAP